MCFLDGNNFVIYSPSLFQTCILLLFINNKVNIFQELLHSFCYMTNSDKDLSIFKKAPKNLNIISMNLAIFLNSRCNRLKLMKD